MTVFPGKPEEHVENALRNASEHVISTVASLIVHLGSKIEWSMEDNFTTTETIAALAKEVGLPDAGDQDAEELEFWRKEARKRGIYVGEDED